MKKDSAYGVRRGYIKPVMRISRVIFPEPPSKHHQKLKRKEKSDKYIKPFIKSYLTVRSGNDILAELFWTIFKDCDREEKAANH